MLNFPWRHIYTRNRTKSPETSESQSHPRREWRSLTVSCRGLHSPVWRSNEGVSSLQCFCVFGRNSKISCKITWRQRCLNGHSSSENHSWPSGGPQQQLQSLVATKPEDTSRLKIRSWRPVGHEGLMEKCVNGFILKPDGRSNPENYVNLPKIWMFKLSRTNAHLLCTSESLREWVSTYTSKLHL